MAVSLVLFKGVSPPSGRVIDTVTISNDRILVMTTGGAGLYIPNENRWLKVTGLSQSKDARLFNTGEYLLLVTKNQLQTMEND